MKETTAKARLNSPIWTRYSQCNLRAERSKKTVESHPKEPHSLPLRVGSGSMDNVNTQGEAILTTVMLHRLKAMSFDHSLRTSPAVPWPRMRCT